MVPMAGQDAVFDRAAMERESKMRAAIIEGKHLSIIINDEYRTAGAANDDHTHSLQLLQRRYANEISGAGGKLSADPYFGHVGFKDRGAGSLRSHPPLALQPGEPNRLPTSGGASMPLVVER